jgi:hypothetical protein
MKMNQIARTSRGGPSLCLAITTGDEAATVTGRWSGRGVWSSLMTGSYAACDPNRCGGRSRIRRRRKRRHR